MSWRLLLRTFSQRSVRCPAAAAAAAAAALQLREVRGLRLSRTHALTSLSFHAGSRLHQSCAHSSRPCFRWQMGCRLAWDRLALLHRPPRRRSRRRCCRRRRRRQVARRRDRGDTRHRVLHHWSRYSNERSRWRFHSLAWRCVARLAAERRRSSRMHACRAPRCLSCRLRRRARRHRAPHTCQRTMKSRLRSPSLGGAGAASSSLLSLCQRR